MSVVCVGNVGILSSKLVGKVDGMLSKREFCFWRGQIRSEPKGGEKVAIKSNSPPGRPIAGRFRCASRCRAADEKLFRFRESNSVVVGKEKKQKRKKNR